MYWQEPTALYRGCGEYAKTVARLTVRGHGYESIEPHAGALAFVDHWAA